MGREDGASAMETGANGASYNFPTEIPKAQVSSSGDSISMSIEETNRVRVAMGLKPLNMKPPKTLPTVVSRDDLRQKTAEAAAAARDEEMKEKLERARVERSLMEVSGLGEDTSVDDASSWIKKSRELEEKKKAAAAQAARLLEQDEMILSEQKRAMQDAYTSKHLRGMVVGHGAEEFEDGTDTIMTLKDQNVLADGDDELENVNLLDDQRAKRNVERKKTKAGYRGYDEDETNADGTRKILSKYDRNEETPLRKTTMLGDEGVVLDLEERRKAEVSKRLAAGANSKMMYSLDTSKSMAKDFYSAEEMAQFKKPKEKKEKKKRKIRKNKGDDEEKSIADQLLPLDSGLAAADHGKRNPDAADQKAHDAKVTQLGRFQNAIERANREVAFHREPEPEMLDDDDDLQAALERTRRLKQAEQQRAKHGIEAVLSAVERTRAADGAAMDTDEQTESLVFNPTQEFVRHISVKQRVKQETDHPGGTATTTRRVQREEEEDGEDDRDAGEFRDVVEKRIKVEGEDDDGARSAGEEGEGSAQDMEEEQQGPVGESFVPAEPLTSQGMAATMALLRNKGVFHEDDSFVGRQRDPTIKPGEGGPRVCEYIDQTTGKRLTTKEAWRRMAHKFHGKKPSLNKTEKFMAKLDDEAYVKRVGTSGDTPLATLQRLQERQAAAKTAGLVLSNAAVKALGDGTESVVAVRPVMPREGTGGKMTKGKRAKVEFGLGGQKRKATDDGGAPAAKRARADE